MSDAKFCFRETLIHILDQLTDNDRKKLSFLLGDDIERRIRDDPTIGGTMDGFQQLLDREKISEENFSYLINAFETIKCYQAANNLKKLQTNLSKKHMVSNSKNNLFSTIPANTFVTDTNNISTVNNSTLIDHLLEDMVDDKMATTHVSQMDPRFNQNNNTKNKPVSFTPLLTSMTESRNSSPLPITKIESISLCDGVPLSKKHLLVIIIVTILIVLFISTLLYVSLQKPKRNTFSQETTSTSTSFVKSTNTNLTKDRIEQDEKCLLPYDKSCTSLIPWEIMASGLGVYYQKPCNEVGCNFQRPYCRLCTKHPSEINNPYPACPKCVPDMDII